MRKNNFYHLYKFSIIIYAVVVSNKRNPEPETLTTPLYVQFLIFNSTDAFIPIPANLLVFDVKSRLHIKFYITVA